MGLVQSDCYYLYEHTHTHTGAHGEGRGGRRGRLSEFEDIQTLLNTKASLKDLHRVSDVNDVDRSLPIDDGIVPSSSLSSGGHR